MRCLALLLSTAAALSQAPERPPGAEGELAPTGSYVLAKGKPRAFRAPPFVYDAKVATGRKVAKVIVLVYDPVLKSKGNQRLTQWVKAGDPLHWSQILVDVIRQASWGYLNYEIQDVITVDGYAKKVDGFRYTEDSYLAARAKNDWQPSPSSYRDLLVENHLVERIRKEGITEVWLWGAPGFHWDEFAGYIHDRYRRFPPTDNEWFYRPYDIPGDLLGKTFWIMGFNYECGPDNMIHSYTHRVESMAALAFADGDWDPKARRDPWNVFSLLECDFPGTPSMVGNCHVPPNGQSGYDYGNARVVQSWADNWVRYPDLRGAPRAFSKEDWGGTQFGYQKWILERLPKGPGTVADAYANWWVYMANVDGDLPEWTPPAGGELQLPEGLPAPRR